MEKQVVPIQIAKNLVVLGFDEPCFAIYDSIDGQLHTWRVADTLVKSSDIPDSIIAPLWQQALWFLEDKFGVRIGVIPLPGDTQKFLARARMGNIHECLYEDTRYEALVSVVEKAIESIFHKNIHIYWDPAEEGSTHNLAVMKQQVNNTQELLDFKIIERPESYFTGTTKYPKRKRNYRNPSKF